MRRRWIRRPRQVSLKDVAASAGVDPSTVSRALRRDPWIPTHTRDRIVQIASDMGYVPNAAARSLAGVGSKLVGLCLSGLSDTSVLRLTEGIDARASKRGYRLLLALFGPQKQHQRQGPRSFQHRQRFRDSYERQHLGGLHERQRLRESPESRCVRDFREHLTEGIVVLGSLSPDQYLATDEGYLTPLVVVDHFSLLDGGPADGKRHTSDGSLTAGGEVFDILYWLIRGQQPPYKPLFLPVEQRAH